VHNEHAHGSDTVGIAKYDMIDLARSHDVAVWEGRARIEKFHADDDVTRSTPYEIIETGPNLLLTAGVALLWNLVTAGGGTAWSAANARIAVGSGTAAVDAGQTALSSEMTRQGMVSGYPTISGNTVTFQAQYGTAVANGQWTELGLVNASSNGVLLNRLYSAAPGWGTKTSSATWVATLSISLS
jgi:hypothetical protein